MKSRPILFQAPMVNAILAREKTQTRRTQGLEEISKSEPAWEYAGLLEGTSNIHGFVCGERTWDIKAPFEVGMHLWVRETLRRANDGCNWIYSAGMTPLHIPAEHRQWARTRRQSHCVSIHMPRWASRITLEVTGVRVERLQDISERDASAEGFLFGYNESSDVARQWFRELWNSLHKVNEWGEPAWDQNPFVWVVEFRRVEA